MTVEALMLLGWEHKSTFQIANGGVSQPRRFDILKYGRLTGPPVVDRKGVTTLETPTLHGREYKLAFDIVSRGV
jgi:hypothetical protein